MKGLNDLYELYENKAIDSPEMLNGLSSMVAHNTKAKQKRNRVVTCLLS